jgi:hypothetical protein
MEQETYSFSIARKYRGAVARFDREGIQTKDERRKSDVRRRRRMGIYFVTARSLLNRDLSLDALLG